MADAMYRVLSDGELREELRERGLRRAQAFSWKRTGAEISGVIDEVSRAWCSKGLASGAAPSKRLLEEGTVTLRGGASGAP